jgi:hypothetical protein
VKNVDLTLTNHFSELSKKTRIQPQRNMTLCIMKEFKKIGIIR